MTASSVRHSIDAETVFLATGTTPPAANNDVTSAVISFDLLSAYWNNSENAVALDFTVFGAIDAIVDSGATLTIETSVTGAFDDTVAQVTKVVTAVGAFTYTLTREQLGAATAIRVKSTKADGTSAAGFWAYMAPITGAA